MSKISEQMALEKTTKNIEAFGLTKTFNWMKKIIEQKAFEAYPIIEGNSIDWGQYEDLNEDTREAYIEGYNQAFQDFMEKACDYLQKNLWRVVIEDGEFRQRFVTDFKNYMQDE